MNGSGDKSEPKMKPQPAPGAYLCESTERYAAYWLNAAREARDQERYADAVMFAEQAVNGWKNLAYGLARSAHYYSLQQRGDSAPSAVVASKGETPRTDSLYCPEFGTLLHVDTEEGYEHACKLERELASLVDTLHRELLNSGLVTAEQWNDAIAPRLMNLGLAVRAQPSHARLTKPAQVGNTIFDTGVEERLVIDRAHREYEYQQTPERQEDRRKRREDFIASVQAGCQECHPVNGCPNPNLCVVTKRLPTPDDAQPSSRGQRAMAASHGILPDCMLPDGAEPCAAYQYLEQELKAARSATDAIKALQEIESRYQGNPTDGLAMAILARDWLNKLGAPTDGTAQSASSDDLDAAIKSGALSCVRGKADQ